MRQVRVRGGAFKLRALRLDSGIFSWGAEGISRKARIIEVVYNGANNEYVRTNTLTRGEVVLIDSTPFRLWWESYYGVPLKRSKKVVASKAGAAKPAKKVIIQEKIDIIGITGFTTTIIKNRNKIQQFQHSIFNTMNNTQHQSILFFFVS